MKTVQKMVNVYDVGDVLDIENMVVKNLARSKIVESAKRIVILHCKEKINGEMSYRVLTDDCKNVHVSEQEISDAKYVGTIDLSLLLKNET